MPNTIGLKISKTVIGKHLIFNSILYKNRRKNEWADDKVKQKNVNCKMKTYIDLDNIDNKTLFIFIRPWSWILATLRHLMES